MKALSLLVAFVSLGFASQFASAGECTAAQWNEATSAYGHLSVQDTLTVDSVSLPVTSLCVDGNNLRPAAGSDFQVGDDNTSSDDGALRRIVHWVLPIKGTTEQCVASETEESCTWQEVSYEIPTSGQLSVVDLSLETTAEVCTKTYQIPACGKK